MVAEITAGFSRQPQDLSEHEKLVRELLPDDVADAYLELTLEGARVAYPEDPIDQELLSRHLAYLQHAPDVVSAPGGRSADRCDRPAHAGPP